MIERKLFVFYCIVSTKIFTMRIDGIYKKNNKFDLLIFYKNMMFKLVINFGC